MYVNHLIQLSNFCLQNLTPNQLQEGEFALRLPLILFNTKKLMKVPRLGFSI